MTGPRIRQLVLMSGDLEATSRRLREELGLSDPFTDPIAGEFGLRNELFALGDVFIEVCTPIDPASAGARRLEAIGDCGYMVIFQVPDLGVARDRVRAAGARIVWEGGREGIAGMHVHPADAPGAIVSMDQADPPETWPWAGPAWTGRVGTGAPGRVLGATIGVRDPEAVAARWGELLGVDTDGTTLPLDRGPVTFVADPEQRGLRGIDVEIPDAVRRGRTHADICGVRFTLHPATGGADADERAA